MSNFSHLVFDSCLPLARRLFPPMCLLCGGPGGTDGLCDGCRTALPHLPDARCPVCAVPTPAAETCGRCLKQRPAFDRVVAALGYAFPADVLIHGLKYRGSLAFARPLAAQIADALEAEPYPDVVVPMPLSPRRLAERGFNQAMELARLIAAEFGLRISAQACRRRRDSAPQVSLPWKERVANVRNAFACEDGLAGKSVAVVDDVLTSGATMNELARALKRAGAREVVGWVVARALPG